MRESLYDVDPTDPRAPPQELWDAMSEAERRRVLATLPSEPEWAAPPQGDEHRKLKQGALDALEQYFRRTGRRVYLASELPVYYPGERVFAPDLIAVVDVEPRDRMSWVVSAEKRGIDLVLEIHVGGERGKDLRRNVEWFARLGIPEYFVFDAPRARVFGYRLPEGGARTYEPIIPQGGSWTSIILGLDLVVAQGRLRWVHGGALLPESHELIERLTSMVDQALRRAEEEARRAEEEARRAEEEARRAERLARRLRDLGFDPDAEP